MINTNTPTWLAERIEQGRRAVKQQPCPTCGVATLVGPDHDRTAHVARVDLDPVDPVTEVVKLLAGRYSYDLVRGALHLREPHHYATYKHPVHIEHKCNSKESLW